MSVLDTINAATPNRRSVTICVDGAAQADWDNLAAQLDDAARADQLTGSMAMENTTRVVAAMDEVRDRIAVSEVTFTFERMEWADRLTLQAAHPPRKDNLADRIRGFNIATFYPELIKASCVTVTDAQGDTADEVPDTTWATLLGDPDQDIKGTLSTGQLDKLIQAATAVNDGTTAVPPSARSLLGSRDSGASLAQPSPGTSPRDDSTAGNPPGSPTTSTTTTDG